MEIVVGYVVCPCVSVHQPVLFQHLLHRSDVVLLDALFPQEVQRKVPQRMVGTAGRFVVDCPIDVVIPEKLLDSRFRDERLEKERVIIETDVVRVVLELWRRLHRSTEEPAHHEIALSALCLGVIVLIAAREINLDILLDRRKRCHILLRVILVEDEDIRVGKALFGALERHSKHVNSLLTCVMEFARRCEIDDTEGHFIKVRRFMIPFLNVRSMRAAIILGVTGQDGSYMAETLLAKDYHVIGVTRRTSLPNTGRITSVLSHPRFTLMQGDMGDAASLRTIVQSVASYHRIEVYNLAAQSHVHTSFSQPESTADINGLGVLRILEAIRSLSLGPKVRFYQASTSELYGKVVEVPQRETTPFYPRSPYGVAKLYAYWIVKNYRESYGLFACNGILFNHESERRGEDFITRKITKGIARLYRDPSFTLELGNLEAKRDWGHAEDYVQAMWLMLQQDHPDDYVVATGQLHSVREFVEAAFRAAGHTVRWEGEGVAEVGLDEGGRVVIRINPSFYRPAEVDLLIGDATKARTVLGWTPTISFDTLVQRMVTGDMSSP